MEKGKLKRNNLLERFFNFAIEIIKMATLLPKTPAGFAIASQVIRSGTSIGANCEEAQDAISRKEFLKTLNISLKEAKETRYWLRIIKETELLQREKLDDILKENNEIIAIFTASVKKLKKSI